jgi:hypothetical protein
MSTLFARYGWQPLRHGPRRIWVECATCHSSAINEDKALRGWQETLQAPRFYRCPACCASDVTGRKRR